MRFLSRFCITVLLITIVIQLAPSALAASPPPQTPLTPPRVPEQALPFAPLEPQLSSNLQAASLDLANLPPLKAVLVVGPIDGDNGPWTQEEIASMELAAAELQAKGVTVHKFYTPNNSWDQIKSAAQGAHFLLYRGHGVYSGDANYPTKVGGFALKDKMISPEVLQAELRLAPNAIVMLYGCYTAGSSSADTIPLASAEAQRRVQMYAQPFVENGAGGYFADWFGTAFQMFIRYLFQGQTLGQAYESYFDFNPATVERYQHPSDARLAFWLDKDEWYDPKPQYNNAFIGLASATLSDLFAGPVIAIEPQAVHFLAEPLSGPRTLEVQINSHLRDLVWTTTVSPAVSWIVAPSRGSAGEPLVITLTPPPSVGLHQATITLQASSSSTAPLELLIPVALHVAEEVHNIYLPGMARAR